MEQKENSELVPPNKDNPEEKNKPIMNQVYRPSIEIGFENRISENKDDGNRFTQAENDFLLNPIEGLEGQNDNTGGQNAIKKDKKKKGKDSLDNILFQKTVYEYKIIIVGEISVGKTSFLGRYINNYFTEDYKCTVAPENKTKRIDIDENVVANLTIWDTAGEEKYRSITKKYYVDSHGAIIVFDLTNKESFKKIKTWVKDINDYAPKDVVVMIVGNKSDLTKEKVVTEEEAKTISDKYLYYEVSAKTGNNIALAFEQITYKIIEKQKEEENNPDKVIRGKHGRKTVGLVNFNDNFKEKKKACLCI